MLLVVQQAGVAGEQQLHTRTAHQESQQPCEVYHDMYQYSLVCAVPQADALVGAGAMLMLQGSQALQATDAPERDGLPHPSPGALTPAPWSCRTWHLTAAFWQSGAPLARTRGPLPH
jgi:hypothetical protein